MPPPLPRITVAMSVHNDARHVGETIESILGQTIDDFEFLIVNDGSSDASPTILDACAGRDARIRVIHQVNFGLVASLNRLIAEARAPLIARIDSDDVALPDRFARQLAYLDAHPECGVLGGQAEDIDEEGRSIGPGYRRSTAPKDVAAALDHGSPIIHPSVMMRTELIRGLGGYRAAYRHCEDYDLWLRVREVAGLANLDVPLIRYRRSPDQVSNRHIVAQTYGALVARAAAGERAAGLPDPTEDLAALPSLDDLDLLFGRAGLAQAVRQQLTLGLLHSGDALRGEGFAIVIDHIARGGPRHGLWRTAGRLVRMGAWARAAQLTRALLG